MTLDTRSLRPLVAVLLVASCASQSTSRVDPAAPADVTPPVRRATRPTVGEAPRARPPRQTRTAPRPAGPVAPAAPTAEVWNKPATWSAAGDPSTYEIPLPAENGWNASLVIDNGTTGIWTVEALPVFDALATPEVVGLDDKGRCHILTSYSGKWSDFPTIYDMKWLGGLAHADIDPRIPGGELYTGGERGNLYQVVAYPQFAVDHRLIAYLPGCEIHTIVAGELDPAHEGPELLVFTRPGGLFRVTPTGPDGRFETKLLCDLPGRVRDALVIETGDDSPPTIACVSRAGWLKLLTMTTDGPHWETVYEAPMGMGRVAQAPLSAGRGVVLYTTHDDGRILRHARSADGRWTTEVIYEGPLGPRGVASGRFDADPSVETVATFGYSGRVELLSRRADGWHAETLFHDRDKGHWLVAAELDGRNDTDELLASGYAARIVLLTRPPGYGKSVPANAAER